MMSARILPLLLLLAPGAAAQPLECSDVTGTVFEDRNGNGYREPGEAGLAGVRLATLSGLLVRTDAAGRFHIACPDTPGGSFGAAFVLKLDTRTLPSGYRLTTENPRMVRLARGTATQFSFGARPGR